MIGTWARILLLTSAVLADGISSALHSPARSPEVAKTLWTHRAQDDASPRQPSEGVSHGTSNGAAEILSEYPSRSATTVAEYWRPGYANLTMSNGNGYGYGHSRPYSSLPNSHVTYLKDWRGASYQYQPRPMKKNHPHYLFNKIQLHSSDSSKTKYKKTVPYPSASVPVTYKNLFRPRVHKPYAKHKYPTQKTVHSPHRKYYQSPYQRYVIPVGEVLRQRATAQGDYSHYSSTYPASSNDHHTTERMSDAYPDGSAPSEDYAHYNDTIQHSDRNYYDDDGESDRTAIEKTSAYDETTTRGYYGDRIYMSTHVPLHAPDKDTTSNAQNNYFILKRTSDEDDIETIFE